MFDKVAFGALVRRKRGKTFTQQSLAVRIWGDPGRKADISRIENGKVTPQEQTVQFLCETLGITDAEMEPIRRGAPVAEALNHIAALTRDDLELLASRFEISGAHDLSEDALREVLTEKAKEYRAYRQQIDSLDERVAAIANLKGAAQDAAERLDFDTVEELLARVTEVEAEIFAESTLARAQNALLRNRADDAYALLTAAAEALAVKDPLEPARWRTRHEDLLYQHGLRYGGSGLLRAVDMNEAIIAATEGRDSWLWSNAQQNLAIALETQGSRTAGAAGNTLLSRAVAAYEAALTVFTKDAHPVQWATTQQNLAIALQTLGSRTASGAGTALLSRAVQAFESALTVFMRDAYPMQWATTQQNLANALGKQGGRTAGAAGKALLSRAVAAYEAALTVRTKDAHPVDWAMTQQNLAITLEIQGNRTAGEAGNALLSRAVTAYEAALTLLTKEAHPVDWAGTQQNLAAALQTQGSRTAGAAGKALLCRAVTAYEAALTVRTREAMPQIWAETQENLAILYKSLAEHDSCDDPHAALRQALAHVEAALEVYDPEHSSYRHEQATALRGLILDRLAAAPE